MQYYSPIHAKSRSLRSTGRRRFNPAAFENLESRLLLSFANTDVSGLWSFAGTNSAGSIQFNNSGGISGGALNFDDGSSATPSGTYTIQNNGDFAITVDSANGIGAINSASDVIAFSGTATDNRLTVMVSSGNGAVTFANSDLLGSWTLEFNGPSGAANGGGTVIFDGEGEVTGGFALTNTGNHTITGGNYVVNADGSVSINLEVSGAGTLSYLGAMNASKDLLAVNPPDLQAASANGSSNLSLLVRSSGIYSNSDATGTWTIAAEDGSGFVVLDGASHITSGTFTNVSGEVDAVTGNYTVASNGKFSVNVTLTANATSQHFSFTGAINASRNVIIESRPNGNNLLVLINSNNHAPTLATIAPLNLASPGNVFAFAYDSLLQSSNATDFDRDTLTFQITSLGSGNLTLNGSDVTTTPVVIASGDTLTWTSDPAASGTITAFSVKASDGTLLSATDVPVAINTIITQPFSDSDLSNTWNLSGAESSGTIQFDGAGNITGGSVTDDSGTTDTPTGTYIVDPTGTLIVHDDTLNGAINATRDVAAVSSAIDNHALSVIINNQNSTFSLADLTGTWSISFDGRDPNSNGGGSITFNGAGNITGGSIKTGTQSFSISGNYTLSAAGLITVSITNLANNSTITLHGAMNDSKDIVAMSADDLQAASANQNPLLMMFVRSAGVFSNADFKGTWTIAGDGTTGFITLDGAGHVSNGLISVHNDSGPDTSPIGGTYSVASNGKVTLNVLVTIGGVQQVFVLSGAMNSSRNTIVQNHTGGNSDSNLTVLISSADHAPTMTTILPFATAIAGQPFEFTYDDLINHANEADFDGDIPQFQITSLTSGALEINGNAVNTFPAVVAVADILTWTPAANTSGALTAFSIKAFDGTLASATTLPVKFTTVLPPIVSAVATRPSAFESNNSSTGLFTLTRSGGILTAPLTVNLNLAGTADLGTDFYIPGAPLGSSVEFPANVKTLTFSIVPNFDHIAEGNETVLLTLTPDANYTLVPPKDHATITIKDGSPTISIAATKPAASETNNGTTTGIGLFTLTRTGDVADPLTVNYTLSGNATNTDDYTTLTGTVTFAAGSKTATITLIPVDDALGEGPETVTLTLAPDAGPSYNIAPGPKNTATVTITDNEPLISIVANKPAAKELLGTTTGAGQFTVTRVGGNLANPLTVNYTIAGSATNTDDYATLTGNVTFLAGKNTALINLLPVDDLLIEGSESVQLTLAPDAGTTYGILSAKSVAVATIADHNRPLILGGITPITGATMNTPLVIPYATVLTASGLSDPESEPIFFRITKVLSGTLRKNGVLITPGITTLIAGESLTWTPALNATGTLPAFAVQATDGSNFTTTLNLSVTIT